jgi:hypothetical protein
MLLVHQKSLNPVIPDESTIPTYMQYYPAVPSKFACAISNHSTKTYVSCACTAHGAINIFHAKWVILKTGVYSLCHCMREAGNWDAQSRNQKEKYNKQTPLVCDCLEGTRGFG